MILINSSCDIQTHISRSIRVRLSTLSPTSWCEWCLQSYIFITPFLSASVNTLRPRQDGRYFADDICKCIFLNGNVWVPIKISLKFIPRGPINNIPTLVQIMAWRRPGDKPLSEPMMVRLPTHKCVTRPQWVKPAAHIDLLEPVHAIRRPRRCWSLAMAWGNVNHANNDI